MRKSIKLISTAMAAVMTASAFALAAAPASAATLKKPKSVKAVNTKSGIKITWKAAKGAKKYKVLRGKKVIKTTTKKSFTDKKVKAGKKYTYTVKSVNGKKTASSKTVSVYRLKAVTGVKASNYYGGVALKWKKAAGASKYKIYRKTSGGKYKLIKTVGNKKSFTDETVKNGTKYYYKLKAYKAGSTSAASASAAKTFVDAVSNVKTDISVNGDTTVTVISWDKNPVATSYKIYGTDRLENKTLIGVTEDTTFTIEFTSVNPSYFAYTIVAVKSAASYPNGVLIGHFPEGCYFTDSEGNVNVNLKLKEGESYTEGPMVLAPMLIYKLAGMDVPVITVVEGEGVVSISEVGVIKAESKGTAKIKITLPPDSVDTIQLYLSMLTNGEFHNKLETGVVYVNVNVE